MRVNIGKSFPLFCDFILRHFHPEPVQEGPDARRKEALRAERTGSYVSMQGRLTTQQMALHGQAPREVGMSRDKPTLSANALEALRVRYLQRASDGEIDETPSELF